MASNFIFVFVLTHWQIVRRDVGQEDAQIGKHDRSLAQRQRRDNVRATRCAAANGNRRHGRLVLGHRRRQTLRGHRLEAVRNNIWLMLHSTHTYNMCVSAAGMRRVVCGWDGMENW